MIQAKVIADSSANGNRITTMVVTMPRYILAEFNTHRMFSRNSASSRAIPFKKMAESIKTHPFIPIAWQEDHSGMQGTKYLEHMTNDIEDCWLRGRDAAIEHATELNQRGVTKQMANRQLEAYMYHTVIVTSTEWENFFALRCPQYVVADEPIKSQLKKSTYRSRNEVINDYGVAKLLKELDWLKMNQGQADIHMMATAEAMYDALNESTPRELEDKEWHIPFGDQIDDDKLEEVLHGPYRASYIRHDGDKQQAKIEIATAMCARVSYTVVGEESKAPNYENDLRLHDRLAASGHWSPFEHCAQVPTLDSTLMWGANVLSGNLPGFIQYRKTFQNENIK